MGVRVSTTRFVQSWWIVLFCSVAGLGSGCSLEGALTQITNNTNLDFTAYLFSQPIATIRTCLLSSGKGAYTALTANSGNNLYFTTYPNVPFDHQWNYYGSTASMPVPNNNSWGTTLSWSAAGQTILLHGGMVPKHGSLSLQTAQSEGGYFFILIGTDDNGFTRCETYFNASYLTDEGRALNVVKAATDVIDYYWVNPFGWGQEYVGTQVAGVPLYGNTFTVTLMPRSSAAFDAIAYIDSYGGSNTPEWTYKGSSVNNPGATFDCYFKYPSQDTEFVDCYLDSSFAL